MKVLEKRRKTKMDAIIKAALTDQLNSLKRALSDDKEWVKAYRRSSLRNYREYKKKKRTVAAYEDAIARIEKELKNAD